MKYFMFWCSCLKLSLKILRLPSALVPVWDSSGSSAIEGS